MRLLVAFLCCAATWAGAQQVKTTGAYWDQQLEAPYNLSVDVKTLVLPDDALTPDVAAGLKTLGVTLVCHVSVGTVEDWHPDFKAFPDSTKLTGAGIDDPYIDIRQSDVVLPLIKARFDACKTAGFDAIEPDHMDIFENVPKGLITKTDQARFMLDLADYAHSIGLKIAQKNAPELIEVLEPKFDFLIMESCFRYGFCAMADPYLRFGKDVLTVEYPEKGVNMRDACARSAELGLKTVFKSQSLEAGLLTC